MGSRRYWIIVGVLAAMVGLIVFALTSTSPVAEPSAAPGTAVSTTSAGSTTTATPTTTGASTTTAVPSTTVSSTVDASTTSQLSTLPLVVGGGPDWLSSYDPPPPVLTGQVVDVDGDGEPDVALFGAAESPLIYTIDDEGEPADMLARPSDLTAEPLAPAADPTAAQGQIEQLTRQFEELEAVTQGLQEQLGDSPTSTTTTIVSQQERSQSSGLTPTQESLLLALISTAGVVLVGVGAPVMTAWARRRFGEAAE